MAERNPKRTGLLSQGTRCTLESSRDGFYTRFLLAIALVITFSSLIQALVAQLLARLGSEVGCPVAEESSPLWIIQSYGLESGSNATCRVISRGAK